jgi:antitoxin component YwqK of YwqJK toxin-antitoxin module
MKRHKSDIPGESEERLISEYRQEGPLTFLRIAECVFNGQVVGRRAYDSDGKLIIETPLRNNQKHGREYTWNDEGTLESVEPYFEGKLHGLSKQYGRKGRVIGTYRCVHGTGFDIWRYEREDGSVRISEIHSLQNGLPHGYEWWLRADQASVWHERHWQQGMVHGIERLWNNNGILQRGYPKFWIQGRAVNKRVYLKAAAQDNTLPTFRAGDNRPQRQFPAEIENLFAKSVAQ